jgi:hypothetical protein
MNSALDRLAGPMLETEADKMRERAGAGLPGAALNVPVKKGKD